MFFKIKIITVLLILGLFTSLNGQSRSKNNDGVIVISENSNEALFDLIADGLDRATELEIEY